MIPSTGLRPSMRPWSVAAFGSIRVFNEGRILSSLRVQASDVPGVQSSTKDFSFDSVGSHRSETKSRYCWNPFD
jgi:hypothetical protein